MKKIICSTEKNVYVWHGGSFILPERNKKYDIPKADQKKELSAATKWLKDHNWHKSLTAELVDSKHK